MLPQPQPNASLTIRDHFKSLMKKTLDLGRSRLSPSDFNSFRTVVVDLTYSEIDKIFQDLINLKIIKSCFCKKGISNRVKGYYDPNCQCNGTGYLEFKEEDAPGDERNKNK